MVWYGVEPAVLAIPDQAIEMAASSQLPIVREYIARRVTLEIERQPEIIADLLQRQRLGPESEALADDLALAHVQLVHRLGDQRSHLSIHRRIERRGRVGIGQRDERVVRVRVRRGRVDRVRLARVAEQVVHFLDRQTGRRGQLLAARIPTQLFPQSLGDLVQLRDLDANVARQTDDT